MGIAAGCDGLAGGGWGCAMATGTMCWPCDIAAGCICIGTCCAISGCPWIMVGLVMPMAGAGMRIPVGVDAAAAAAPSGCWCGMKTTGSPLAGAGAGTIPGMLKPCMGCMGCMGCCMKPPAGIPAMYGTMWGCAMGTPCGKPMAGPGTCMPCMLYPAIIPCGVAIMPGCMPAGAIMVIPCWPAWPGMAMYCTKGGWPGMLWTTGMTGTGP